MHTSCDSEPLHARRSLRRREERGRSEAAELAGAAADDRRRSAESSLPQRPRESDARAQVHLRRKIVRAQAERRVDQRVLCRRASVRRALEANAVVELQRAALSPRVTKVERWIHGAPRALGRCERAREGRGLIVLEILERVEGEHALAIVRDVLIESRRVEQSAELDAMRGIAGKPGKLIAQLEALRVRRLRQRWAASEAQGRDAERAVGDARRDLHASGGEREERRGAAVVERSVHARLVDHGAAEVRA